MKSVKFSAIALFLLIFMSCGPQVVTQKTTDKSLSIYDTFAFLPNAEIKASGEAFDDEELNSMIIETINSEMRQAGYRLDRQNPDLLVLADANIDLERQTTTEPVYATYPYATRGLGVSPFYNPYY